jgi:hypothetical protein
MGVGDWGQERAREEGRGGGGAGMGQTGGQTKRGRINERGGEEDEVVGGVACVEGGTGWCSERCSSKGRRGKGDKTENRRRLELGGRQKEGKTLQHIQEGGGGEAAEAASRDWGHRW